MYRTTVYVPYNCSFVRSRVVDPKLFFSDPYPDPDPIQTVSDPNPYPDPDSDPAWFLKIIWS